MGKHCNNCKHEDKKFNEQPCISCFDKCYWEKPDCPDCAKKDAEISELKAKLNVAELEKWQQEIDRLNKALKLQQEVSGKLAEQKVELQEKLQNSMWDTENERINRELVEIENDKLKGE